MARGNGRMTIFRDDRDYRSFIQMFREVIDAFALECWNYCLMPNHYHSTIRPTKPNISAAIQHLNGRYAQWWNHRHATVGHVFQGRFKAQIVQRDSYAVALARYVALNPVRAGLVERPEDWAWSSYAATIGLEPPPSFLSMNPALALFGLGDRATLQRRFSTFVQRDCADAAAEERIRLNSLVIGDADFRERVLRGQT